MAYRVEVSRTADVEAEEAYEWRARRAPIAARRWYSGLLEAIRSLEDNPRRCPLAPEDEYFTEEIRNLIYGKRQHRFRIIYTIQGDVVQVLHVRHAARTVFKPPSKESENPPS